VTRAELLDQAVASVFAAAHVGKAFARYGLTPAIADLVRARFRVLAMTQPTAMQPIMAGAPAPRRSGSRFAST
jgi:hypothetical protein